MNRKHPRKHGSLGFLVSSMILCLGSGIVLGQGEKTREGPDSWTVSLVYREEDPEQKTHWKTKKELKATFSSETLLFQEGDAPFLEIPAAGIRSLFYDKAPQKKLLQDLTEPQDPVTGSQVKTDGYLSAQVALGAYAVSWASVVGPGLAYVSTGVIAPAAVFPPALIAVGGIVAIQMLKNSAEHFVHVIWEDGGSFSGAVIALKKKQRDSLLSALEEITGRKCLNLPEERKRLEAEIKAQKPDHYEFSVTEKTSFGPLLLKKREERYKLILLEREDAPSELYFFHPSISMKRLQGVVLVEVVEGDPSPSGSRRSRDRHSVSVTYGTGPGPQSVEAFQLGARRVRPANLGDAQDASDQGTP